MHSVSKYREELLLYLRVHKERMKQNLDIFDFELTEDEMTRLKQLDENKSMWAEYDDPMIVQYAMSEE